MRYPCLVPKRLCKTDITWSFEQEGLNEYGEPLKTIEYSGKCNYQDKARTVLTAEKKLVQITGTALFQGDICPELPVISGGSAEIFGVKRRTGNKGKKSGWFRELYGGDADMSNLISVNSVIKLNLPMIRKLTEAQATALEQTAEALHTEVVQAQVFPRDTGNLQNESTFLDRSESENGKVSIVSSTPYARRLYFHPEYHFQTGENPNARGKWYTDWLPGGKEADFAAKAFKEIYRRLTGI